MPDRASTDPDVRSAKLDLARQYHLAGRMDDAQRLYGQVLSEEPATGDALHGLGIMALQLGQHLPALDLLQRAVAVNPNDWRYHCTLGQVLTALKQLDESAAAYRRAAELKPRSVEAAFGLGLALHAAGKRPEAIIAYRRTLELRPDYVEAHNNLGNALQSEGHLEEAIEAYCRALKLRPEYVEALSNLGGALQGAGKLEEAIAIFRRALDLRPDYAPLCNNLGNALAAAKQRDDAATVLQRAVKLDPNLSQGWYNLGNVLRDQEKFAEAAAAYRSAITLRPDYVEAHNNLGNVLHALGDFKEAAAAYLKALTIKPDFVDAYSNVGSALRTMGQIDQAIDLLRQALFLKPDFHIGHCNLGNILKDAGRLDEALGCYRRAVELKRDDAISHSNLVYAVHFHPDYDGPAILRENLRWNALHAQRLTSQAQPPVIDSSADRRLRIGYVSPDFRDHCQSLFTQGLLANHDHARFEIFCYANVPRPDEVTRRLAGYADAWRPTSGVSDEKLAVMIRADRIDILVDLTMHMSHGRPLLFARKPAPVQAAWLAYPGTTGLSAMDYRLTDPYLDPPGENDWHYSETSIRLADTFWCYDPLATEPEVNALPALENGRVTFGCLNNFCKISPATLAVWGQVLASVPESRLILLCQPGAHRGALIEKLAEWGVTAEQIEFVPFQSRADYLRVYHRIDLGLDTMPYNGHTTSLDSFWMGVPVVTRIGSTAVGRAGWSQLCNLNLRELAATSDDGFVRLAVELAGDTRRLIRLRSTLRQRMEQSPLMDAKRFARSIEAAYQQMHQAELKRAATV